MALRIPIIVIHQVTHLLLYVFSSLRFELSHLLSTFFLRQLFLQLWVINLVRPQDLPLVNEYLSWISQFWLRHAKRWSSFELLKQEVSVDGYAFDWYALVDVFTDFGFTVEGAPSLDITAFLVHA